MSCLSLTLLAVALTVPGTESPRDATALTTLVSAIRGADFRGEREALRRLAADLDQVKSPRLGAYRDYWRGFALWRSAINGFNETPTPGDLQADLEGAAQAFRAALKLRPDWIEPKVSLSFCLANLAMLSPSDTARLTAVRTEVAALGLDLKDERQTQDNPRLLWLIAGTQLFQRGDAAAAAGTDRRGLQAARDEALRNSRGSTPEWVPAWGAAEHLMSLAYTYSKGALADRELARAYADGALALAPDWHYVRDILVPQIQALPPRGQ